MQQPPPMPMAPPPAPGSAQPLSQTNTLAIVSLVSGILCWVALPVVGAIVAVITGHMARREIRQTGQQGDGLALIGLISGYVHLALGLILILVVVIILVLAITVSTSQAH